MLAKEVAAFDIYGKLRETQLISEEGDETQPRFVIEVVEPACDEVKFGRKNASFFERVTDKQDKFQEVRAAGCTMRGRLLTAEVLLATLKMQVADTSASLEKLARKAAQTETKLSARASGVEELSSAEKDCVRRH